MVQGGGYALFRADVCDGLFQHAQSRLADHLGGCSEGQVTRYARGESHLEEPAEAGDLRDTAVVGKAGLDCFRRLG